MKFLTEEERKKRIQGIIEAFTDSLVNSRMVTPEDEPAQDTLKELNENTLNLLILFNMMVGITRMKAMRQLGWHPAQIKKASEDLLARGYIRFHRLCRVGQGAPAQCCEILPTGFAELEKRGISPTAKLLSVGQFVHDVYGRWVANHLKEQGKKYTAERTLGVKRFDLVEEGGEKLIGHEICLSGSAKLDAEQAIKAASVTGIDAVVCWFADKTLMRCVEQELKSALMWFQNKITLRFLGELWKGE